MPATPPLLVLALLLAAPSLLACSSSPSTPGDDAGDGPGDDGPPPQGVAVEVVASGLENPLHLTAPPEDPRLFVVEQPGRIRIVSGGRLLETPFLDLTDRIRSGGERGLLSVAFHPRYAENGHLYVNYTDLEGDTRIERYRVSPDDPDRAEPASRAEVLSFEQPFSNHNGGLVAFGPDGMLWIGTGDGGSGGDPRGNGQDPGTLLGALLRIDVDGGSPYRVPPDNPFADDAGGRPEVWAYGLRNPWRFSFDGETGLLYIADVGQNRWEEVNVVAADEPGLNFGWNVMEGRHCFEDPSCDPEGLVLPELEYGHDEGCSVTGGSVYRGDAVPALRGRYLYADFCSGRVRSFRYADGEAVERREWPVGEVGSVLSFGEDADGELYLLSANGRVYRFVADG